MKETIEVEIRSFITEEKFEELKAFFNNNAKFITKDYQETYSLTGKEDLRLQRNNFGTKLWLKRGKLHDDYREEFEVNFGSDDFDSIETILRLLGHDTKIKWFRTRNEYDWDGIKIDLDYTRGYGYIIELEIKTDDAGKAAAHKRLETAFARLGIEMSAKEEFEKRFKDYAENWESLTAV